jgi:hypothetical protein
MREQMGHDDSEEDSSPEITITAAMMDMIIFSSPLASPMTTFFPEIFLL